MFRALHVLSRWPGCFVRPWAAARPLAVRAASCARRVVSKPGQAPPPPTAAAARPCGPSGALHTSGAWSLMCGSAPPPPTGIVNLSRETGVAFARAGRASDETDIAFAGEKKLFWARFSVAEVMAVSRWPASAVAVVMAVSTSPRHSCLCAKKFALLGSARTRARKSSPCARKMAHNRRYMACRANFVAERQCCGRSSQA